MSSAFPPLHHNGTKENSSKGDSKGDLESFSCVICLNSSYDGTIATIDTCLHSFCQKCILQWAKRTRTCPLCTISFTSIRVNPTPTGSFDLQEVPLPEAKKDTDIASELECLDHTYFIGEAMRLLSVAENEQRSMLREQKQKANIKFGSKIQNTWEERNWKLLQDVVKKLQDYVTLFRSDEHFEPQSVLNDLYGIQDQIQQIWKDPLKECAPKEEEKTLRYSAEDYDDLSSDSEDEFATCDYERGNSKIDRKYQGRCPQHKASPRKKN